MNRFSIVQKLFFAFGSVFIVIALFGLFINFSFNNLSSERSNVRDWMATSVTVANINQNLAEVHHSLHMRVMSGADVQKWKTNQEHSISNIEASFKEYQAELNASVYDNETEKQHDQQILDNELRLWQAYKNQIARLDQLMAANDHAGGHALLLGDLENAFEAFERAMGHPMMSPEGREELKVILGEVMETFPLAPYIHIGGDETAVTAEFLQEMADVVHAGGKKVITWNPVRTTISASFCDMTQLWSTAGRAIPGIPAIDCRYNYVNHFDVFADLVGIWKSNIYYQAAGDAEQSSDHCSLFTDHSLVAGTLTAVWNDRKLPSEADIIRQNNLYANVLASAERAWSGGGEQYIEQGGTRLPNDGPEYEAFADWERRFLFHKAHSLKDEPIPYVRQSNVRWRISDSEADTAYLWTGAGIYLSHTWDPIVPTGFPPTPNSNLSTLSSVFAWTYVYSSRVQAAGALIEFHNYGRSERDLAPDNGHWDRMGSRIWLNDVELPPPVWVNAGRAVTLEDDMGNENFCARVPYIIQLRRGWNKVLLELPHRHPSGIRKPKWMFTFVITDTEGRNALGGLRYDPDARPQPEFLQKK